MTNHIAYPQISMSQAAQQIAENSRFSIIELEQLAPELCLLQDVVFTGGYPDQLPRESLSVAASSIRTLVKAYNSNFEDVSMTAKSEVDKQLTMQIQSLLPLDRFQASQKGVWSMLAIRALPDLSHWRFPNNSNHAFFERYVGHERNVLQRLWWRAELLGPELACQLQENDLIQMFERPTIGSNPVVLKAMALKAIEFRPELVRIGGKTSDFVSGVAKTILRNFMVISPAAMTHTELTNYLNGVCERQLESMKRSGSTV